MHVNPTDQVLHLSFDDEAFARADVFCGMFNKRQIANKTYKPIEYTTTKLPFKDKSFDLVYAVNVLAYSHQPQVMLDEIKRVAHRIHLKERSEFAEMIFGWDQTKWIIDVENMELIIKSKNPSKIARFGPLFHHLYATDPSFFDSCSQNPGLFNIAVDWNEGEDVVEEVEKEVDEVVIPQESEENKEQGSMFENVNLEEKSETEEKINEIFTTKKTVKVVKVLKSVFRPCQTEYVDNVRIVIGEISDKIDIRNLKNKNLS